MKLQTSFTQASLEVARANRVGKATWKDDASRHLSFQNFMLYPLPTIKESLLFTTCHSFLIDFHNPTPYSSLTSLEYQPPCSFPYFLLITWFQNVPLSFANLQLYLHKSVSLREERHFTLKPLFFFFLFKQTNTHLTRWDFCSRVLLIKKSIWICFNLNLIILGKVSTNMK